MGANGIDWDSRSEAARRGGLGPRKTPGRRI